MTPELPNFAMVPVFFSAWVSGWRVWLLLSSITSVIRAAED
jgi:hypothetical protein